MYGYGWAAPQAPETPGGTPNPHSDHGPLPEQVEHLAACTCGTVGFDDLAEEAGRVAVLLAAGVALREACLMVWGTERDAHRASIRQSFRTRFPWLRLPDWGAS